MDSTTYRDLISPWLDQPAIAELLSDEQLEDLTDQMALADIAARTQIMLEDPTKPLAAVAQQAQERTIYDLFLVPVLGVEPLDSEPETVPPPMPAQLLQKIVREEREPHQPC